MSDEQIRPLFATLDDGREVECVSCTWADPEPDDPAGVLPVNVTLLIDGDRVQTVRVLLTDDEMRQAFGIDPA